MVSATAESKSTPHIAFDDLPEWVSVQAGAEFLGVSRWFLYTAAKRGEIPSRRFGKKLIFIPKSFFDPNKQDDHSSALTTGRSTNGGRS
jgi:hypothetical protein